MSSNRVRALADERTPNPWTELPTQPPYVLPSDAEVVLAAKHLLTDQLPVPFNGARDAPVVFLTLNPGGNSKPDASDYYREQCRRRLTFTTTVPFMTFDDSFEEMDGAKYWRARLQKLIDAVDYDVVRRNILVLQYFPYQSKAYIPLKRKLRSQEFGFDLCREAIRDRRLIVFLRSRKLWTEAVPELARVKAVELKNPRSPYVTPQNIPGDGFARIVAALTKVSKVVGSR